MADYDVTGGFALSAGQSIPVVYDNDFMPFSTDYDVKIDLLDQSGNVLATTSTTVTTPPAH